MHCWHQRVTLEKAEPEDRYGDIVVDTAKSHEVYKEWLAMTRPAPGPDGTRRPYWFDRPLRPIRDAYKIDSRLPSGPAARNPVPPTTLVTPATPPPTPPPTRR